MRVLSCGVGVDMRKHLQAWEKDLSFYEVENPDEALSILRPSGEEDAGYDLVLADLFTGLKLPHFFQSVRRAKPHLPVIVVGGIKDIETKVKLLDAGCDLYLEYPLDVRELMAVMRRSVRRAQGYVGYEVKAGPLCVNLLEKTVSVNDNLVNLSGREYKVLEILAQKKGRVVAYEFLHSSLYEVQEEITPSIVKVFICKLRKKVGTEAAKHIWTKHGLGYQLCDTPRAGGKVA